MMIPGLLCFAGGVILGDRTVWFMVVGMIGFFSMFTLVFALLFAIRCPCCGSNLGYAIQWPAKWDYSVSEKIQFCPFCGVSMDEEMKEKGSNQQVQPIAGKPGSG